MDVGAAFFMDHDLGQIGPETDDTITTDSAKSLLSKVKSEALLASHRRQIISPALEGFPIWEIALLILAGQYEGHGITAFEIYDELASHIHEGALIGSPRLSAAA
jgi:hypothetical protein